jgi:hypothetical protein
VLDSDQLFRNVSTKVMIRNGDMLRPRSKFGGFCQFNGANIVLKDLASQSWGRHRDFDTQWHELLKPLHDIYYVMCRALERAMYLALVVVVVESDMVICNFELQIRGQPANQIMSPTACERHMAASSECSVLKPPEKSASIWYSRPLEMLGLMIRPLSKRFT